MSLSLAIRLLPGGTLPPIAEVLKTINGTLDDVAKEATSMLLEPTEHWNDKPTFVTKTPRPGMRTVTTDHKKYRWTDKGTRRHWIFPRKPGGRLVFQGAFSPKTQPRSLKGSPGSSGPPTVFTPFGILHPGTEPRHFSEVVQAEANRLLKKQLDARLRKLMRRR